MGWFKNFFFGDIEENEHRSSKEHILTNSKLQSAGKEKLRRHQKMTNIKNNNLMWGKTTDKKKLVPRVVYQYPKGKFRFPVIPDALSEKATKHSVSNENKASEVNEKINPKKVFVPTELPSSIFAFQKKLDHFEFDLDKYANRQISKRVHQDIMAKEEMEKFQDHYFPENFLEKSRIPLKEKASNIKSVPISKKIEKKAQSKKALKEETIKIKESVPFSEKKQHILENDTKNSHKSRIPFNVMMVNQDKHALHQKKTTNNEQAVTSEKAKNDENQSVGGINQAKLELEMPSDRMINAGSYHYPPLHLISPPVSFSKDSSWINSQKEILNETLKNFNVRAHVVGYTEGPAVTRFEVQPEKGIKVSKITSLADDIKLSLAAKDIRIEAPIPGKNTVGIEIPNQVSRPVMLSELLNTEAFIKNKSPLTAALGLDISGKPIITDLQKMPHGLIAGATGSGKSVCINSLLISLLYKASPDSLKLLLIDPKIVELAPYNRIPHLLSPVITDAKAATRALKWAVEEMERRYQLFSHTGVRSLEKYNEHAADLNNHRKKLPYILIIIDELADLMMIAPNDVEESISRIAQKARACGIHLIVATQRPSVDVITGLIKANIPTRISFSVSSSVDSRTIIDSTGAEKLLGKGDMLFLASETNKPIRVQGTFVSDEEIEAVIGHVRSQASPDYLFEEKNLLEKETIHEKEDELFDQVCEFVLDQNAASTSLLQRHFRIGYNRAARLMDLLENYNIVSKNNGSKPRDIVITREELDKLRKKKNERIIS